VNQHKNTTQTPAQGQTNAKRARMAVGGGGGRGRMMAGTLKSNIGLGRGETGYISVMTSLWVHHCPIIKKYFQSENVVQTVE